MDYGYLKAVSSFNNITICNNSLGKGRLFNHYVYLIYSHCVVKEVYRVLIAIKYNYSGYQIKVDFIERNY